MTIRNPILPGFFPDPSICRVGEDFYIANSTFEWFPGVPIHHSRDLVNWRLIGHALTRRSQLDLRGVPDSAGVWAPSLSHADGQFWLIYTNLRNTTVTTLRRYTDLPELLYMLRNKKITLLNPANWDDRNDSHYLHLYKYNVEFFR